MLPIRRWVDRRYGTHRGFVRLAFARAEQRVGLLPVVRRVNWKDVRRVVFVCQGNIARSAFAEALARARSLPCASFGIHTTTGMPADARAATLALRYGCDLSGHRTTAVGDFALREGDLLLAMEPRQVRKILADPRLAGAQVSLLGLWSDPRFEHIHDPFGLSDAYLEVCFERIARAVSGVGDQLSR